MELPAGTKRTFDRGHEWLTSGPEKMIVAHCFTGYLRSIVFAACFLSWQGPGFFLSFSQDSISLKNHWVHSYRKVTAA